VWALTSYAAAADFVRANVDCAVAAVVEAVTAKVASLATGVNLDAAERGNYEYAPAAPAAPAAAASIVLARCWLWWPLDGAGCAQHAAVVVMAVAANRGLIQP
jgi:hypothetical protein